jgi:hypothetical protein
MAVKCKFANLKSLRGRCLVDATWKMVFEGLPEKHEDAFCDMCLPGFAAGGADTLRTLNNPNPLVFVNITDPTIEPITIPRSYIVTRTMEQIVKFVQGEVMRRMMPSLVAHFNKLSADRVKGFANMKAELVYGADGRPEQMKVTKLSGATAWTKTVEQFSADAAGA